MADGNIIDYGEWRVPNGWEDLTLKQFQEIQQYYGDDERKFDAREVLHILCGKSIDEVNELPMELTEKLFEHLTWLEEKPPYKEPTNKIVINGEEYSVNIAERLKTGEFVASDTVIRTDSHNYAALLAILCRKEGEKYDSKFEAEILTSRIEMFEKQPFIECFRIISFFLQLSMNLETITRLSSQAEDLLDLSARLIETSRKSGVSSALYTMWLKRKLKKLKKSIKCISQTSSNS